MRVERIKVDSVSFGTLMHDMQQGQIRIPRFQRDFVWDRQRILKLLDSMYKEYPIGTIFLWEAPSKYNHLLRNVENLEQPPLEKDKNYTFILDGQQRLTSLYAVTQGLSIEEDDFSKIVVDLANNDPDKLSFQYRRPDNKRWVAVRDLLSTEIFPIYNNLPGDEDKRRFELFRNALNNYPFSVVIVKNMEIEDAIQIFERINRQGRSLSRYDLISASVLTNEFDLRERTDKDIVQRLTTTFGKIEETSIPQALSLNIKMNTGYIAQLALTTQEVQNAWSNTVESFIAAVDFVRKNLGVARVDFLPYDGILPVLAHYFYYTNTHSVMSHHHSEQIERWFWRTAFSERYGGSSQARMSEDAEWIRSLIDRGTNVDIPLTIDEKILLEGSMRNSTSAIRNGILCLLNLRRPLHFINGTEINISGDHFSSFTRTERHHIFPAGFLKEEGYDNRSIHQIPNFCFIPADLNKIIGDRKPSEYMSEIAEQYGDAAEFEKIMRTHLIPVHEESGIWTDDYELFMKQRAELLVQEIRHLCGIVEILEPEKRNPVVDKIEQALRDTIHHILLTHGQDYWHHAIPADIQKQVEERIDKHVHKMPGLTKSQFRDPRRRLDFCDIADYSKIILSKQNWQLFAPVFKNKDELERVLDDLRNFRNALKHNREIDNFLEYRAQAAIAWLSRVLKVDLADYGV